MFGRIINATFLITYTLGSHLVYTNAASSLLSIRPGTQGLSHLLDRQGKHRCSPQAPRFSQSKLLAKNFTYLRHKHTPTSHFQSTFSIFNSSRKIYLIPLINIRNKKMDSRTYPASPILQ